MHTSRKGFTLLELLIVIAILAILASTVFVVLNPAEILRKSRDTQRISDLASMRSAINFYIANTSSPIMGTTNAVGCVDQGTKYTYSIVTGVLNTANTLVGTTSATVSSSTQSRSPDGSGWLPVNLGSLVGGSPLSTFPVDNNPTLSGDTTNPRYYAYLCNQGLGVFALYANMESQTYRNGGGSDVESKDGGNLPFVYEVGTQFLVLASSTNFYNSTN
jgi:prepilin-type N-terminal cleavage/methylation domain-containing protein